MQRIEGDAIQDTENTNKRRRREYVPANELQEYLEMRIDREGGVRKLARAIAVNSGLISMARTDGYFAPALLEALNVTTHPQRLRWITELEPATLHTVNELEETVGLPRKELFYDMVRIYSAYHEKLLDWIF